MTRLKTESLIETLRVFAGDVGGQLNQAALALASAGDHPFH
jgi:hypothetical protein